MIRVATLGILAGFAAGCASTWDAASSRAFQRELVSNPMRAMFVPDDPMTVLRTNPDGQARAKAIRRLEEPAASGRDDEQAEAMQYLTEAATTDTSPVVRAAAIDALGRFRDPRAFHTLAAAYAQASGTKSDGRSLRSTDPSAPGLLAERSPLFGPSGFPPEVVTLLKTRALEAMAKTGQPEAFTYLADVAGKAGDPKTMTAVDRDVRLAAVKALGTIRTPESAKLLAQVMSAEANRDTAMANRAHEGLVTLTGYSYPVGSPEWDGVMQAGFDVKPEANMIQRAFGWMAP